MDLCLFDFIPSSCIDDKLKSKGCGNTDELKALSEKLKSCASKHGLSMELKSKSMKERDKKVVCKSFHKAGIVSVRI